MEGVVDFLSSCCDVAGLQARRMRKLVEGARLPKLKDKVQRHAAGDIRIYVDVFCPYFFLNQINRCWQDLPGAEVTGTKQPTGVARSLSVSFACHSSQ